MYIFSSNTLVVKWVGALYQYAFKHLIDHGNDIYFCVKCPFDSALC